MTWFARMTGAQQCYLLARVAVVRRSVGGSERQRLQRLQSAAGHCHPARVPGRVEHASIAIDDRDGTIVDAIGRIATRHGDERHMRSGWNGRYVGQLDAVEPREG